MKVWHFFRNDGTTGEGRIISGTRSGYAVAVAGRPFNSYMEVAMLDDFEEWLGRLVWIALPVLVSFDLWRVYG